MPDHESAVWNGASPNDGLRGEQLTGLDWDVPHFSTIYRGHRTLAVNIPYRGSKGPPHILIDSIDIKVEGEGE
jgi:hypothetical protein